MSLPPTTVLSFRPLLESAVRDFALESGWDAPTFPVVLAEIVTSLSRYREEGKRLFPVVFVTRDLDALLHEVAGRDPVLLGTGPLAVETIQRALKQCAPLGEGRTWVVFVHVAGESLRYGVFRSSASPIDPTALERLRRAPPSPAGTLGIVQVAENVIELRAGEGRHRMVHLSGAVAEAIPPMQVSRTFIEALTRDVPVGLREPLGNLYYRVVMDVLQVWHGTLAAVLPAGAEVPDFLSDGVVLHEPLHFAAATRRLLETGDRAATDELQANANLLRGMLGADGITVMRSDGSVVAYNVFIAHPPDRIRTALGGARRRTFDVLSSHVGGSLVAAFYRSQDGKACCTSTPAER